MADTHPNAFRTEAAAKRTAAAQLIDEAHQLDTQAKALEQPGKAPPAADTPLSPGGETFDPEQEQLEADKTEDKPNDKSGKKS